MNILFLSLMDINSLQENGIYPELLREFSLSGHRIFIASPIERRSKRKPCLLRSENAAILKYRIGNITKTGLIEKGLTTLTLEGKTKRAIRRAFPNTRFDLVLYPTPPVTFLGAVRYIKKRDNASTYLMLKDIFPQNAVDLGALSTHGAMGLVYRLFRVKERRLYEVSDYIGCMSEANVRYLLSHNPQIDARRVGLCPNATSLFPPALTKDERLSLREMYGLPVGRKILVMGGNIGKPQAIGFFVDCLRALESRENIFVLAVGNGTEFHCLEAYVAQEQPKHFSLLPSLPVESFNELLSCCDVGLLLLDYRFTIPNFPSRLLSYMQAGLAVLAATDVVSDVGAFAESNGFGVRCPSNSVSAFLAALDRLLDSDLEAMGENARRSLRSAFSAEMVCRQILQTVQAEKRI